MVGGGETCLHLAIDGDRDEAVRIGIADVRIDACAIDRVCLVGNAGLDHERPMTGKAALGFVYCGP